MSTCFFTLTVAESKRLLGQAIAGLPVVQQAMQSGRLIVAGGTTNAYVLEELAGIAIDKGKYTAGVITQGVACLTESKTRLSPAVFIYGEASDRPWQDVIKEFTADDVFIKGANAIDLFGNAGILLGSGNGGTIGAAMGYLAASGAHLVMPVGAEKLIPDVVVAANMLGQSRLEQRIGMATGMFVVNTGHIISETEALASLFDVESTVVAAGGVDGSEGAITMAVKGDAKVLDRVLSHVRKLKEEIPLKIEKRNCLECPNPCLR